MSQLTVGSDPLVDPAPSLFETLARGGVGFKNTMSYLGMPPIGRTAANKGKLSCDSAREHHSRVPMTELVDVQNSWAIPIWDPGIQVVGPKVSVPPAAMAGYNRTVVQHTVKDLLPPGVAFAIHPTAQRFVLRQYIGEKSAPERFRMFLNLRKSLYRDRLSLENGMKIHFIDSRTSEECVLEVKAAYRRHLILRWNHECPKYPKPLVETPSEVKVAGMKTERSSDPASSGTGSSSNPSTLPSECVDDHPSSHAPPSSAASSSSSAAAAPAGVRPRKSSLKQSTRTSSTGGTRKSVGWLASAMNMATGEEEELIDDEESLDSEKLPEEGGSALSASIVLSGKGLETQVTMIDSPATKIFLRGRDLPTSIAASAANKLDPEAKVIDMALDIGLIGAISRENETLSLILPRASKLPDWLGVYLFIPPEIAFPLHCGDTISVSSEGRLVSMRELKFNVPQISRSIPSAFADQQRDMNPNQALVDIVVETTVQQSSSHWNGRAKAVGVSRGTPEPHLFTSQQFKDNRTVKIGRNDCDVPVSDPHVSRHHASLVRRDERFFLMQPQNDKKPTYLLLGKRDEHYRPPVAIRSGDTIVVGRTHLKVVYQQRGNRKIGSFSTRDELMRRVASKTKLCELSVNKDKGSSQVETEPVTKDSGEEPGAPQSTFDSMDPTLEDSINVKGFRDVPALLNYFGMASLGTEPIMILQNVSGPHAHRFYECSPLETLIGSSETVNISVPIDKRMSDLHCRIFFDEVKMRWMVEDMRSKHGTFIKVNTSEPVAVCCGDVYVMGLTLVRILGLPAGKEPKAKPVKKDG